LVIELINEEVLIGQYLG